MPTYALPMIAAVAVAVSLFLLTPKGFAMNKQSDLSAPADKSHPYSGMWITGDGLVRHHLLPNGRYDEARGSRESAYQGRYEVRGNHIYYWDDTGFTADGRFIDDVLHHGGMILYCQ
ncbi:Atu4866 domain-containing protein [Ochrobactrum sp. GPK 3]|uniref:Atu4866 domain-containing protein n=1 Tax=Brucella sp. 22210 TaxID=3453892 RepID=UPI00313859C7